MLVLNHWKNCYKTLRCKNENINKSINISKMRMENNNNRIIIYVYICIKYWENKCYA